MTTQPKQYHHILLPVDFSPCSRHAQEYAADFAARYNADLHLLYVVEPLAAFTAADGVEQSVYFDVMQRLREQSTVLMQESQRELESLGLKVSAQIREGRPADVITEYASQNKIDLICMSTHGRSGLNHVLLGSTTEHVLRRSHCPVFVVRCEAKKK
ncbi:MAG: universal stress protein [Candidatus Kapaibacterium sp.]|jgi:nucleotide-binding universal stress UspA family protein